VAKDAGAEAMFWRLGRRSGGMESRAEADRRVEFGPGKLTAGRERRRKAWPLGV
jgi:hypothetical protein